MSTEKEREARRRKGGRLEIDPVEVEKRVERAVKRFAPKAWRDQSYFKGLLRSMVMTNAIPMDLLEEIPIDAGEAGKTRFDQLYDAAMFLAFPGYRDTTLKKLLGPGIHFGPETKIWRAAFPERFGISHVVLRAPSYQEAFSLACDYACRMSLRSFGNIPADLTIRVLFMTEKAVRRMLRLRWANRVIKRRELQLIGRVYSPKEIMGAKFAALGDPRDRERYSIARYVEGKDLDKIMNMRETVRISAVDAEVRHKHHVTSERKKDDKK